MKIINFLIFLSLAYSRFISAPVVILISTFVVPKWMREKIINAVELLIAFEAHVVFFVSILLKNVKDAYYRLSMFLYAQYLIYTRS